MEGGDEQACGDADGFGDVVILIAIAIGGLAKALGKDGDKPRCGFEKGFVGVCSKGCEVIQPTLWGAMGVKFAFFFFGSFFDLFF